MDDKLRIKFYTTTDLGVENSLCKAEKILLSFDEDQADDLNDVIEYYNITLYFDNRCYLPTWDHEKINRYNHIASLMKKKISIKFHNITNSNFISLYFSVDRRYKDDFWKLFNTYSLFDTISEENIQNLIEQDSSILKVITKRE